MTKDEEQFQKWVAKQESKKKNWLANLEGQEFMRSFREKNRVTSHLQGIHCPICTYRQLYLRADTDSEYLCKECKAEVVLVVKWRPEKSKIEELLDAKKKELEPDDEDDSDEGEDTQEGDD